MRIIDKEGIAHSLKITVGVAEKLQEIGLNLFCSQDADKFFEVEESRYTAIIKFLFPSFSIPDDFEKEAEEAFNFAWAEFYPKPSADDIELPERLDSEEKLDIRATLYEMAGFIGVNPRDFSARELHWLAFGAGEKNLQLEKLVATIGGSDPSIFRNKYDLTPSNSGEEPERNDFAWKMIAKMGGDKITVRKIPKKGK